MPLTDPILLGLKGTAEESLTSYKDYLGKIWGQYQAGMQPMQEAVTSYAPGGAIAQGLQQAGRQAYGAAMQGNLGIMGSTTRGPAVSRTEGIKAEYLRGVGETEAKTRLGQYQAGGMGMPIGGLGTLGGGAMSGMAAIAAASYGALGRVAASRPTDASAGRTTGGGGGGVSGGGGGGGGYSGSGYGGGGTTAVTGTPTLGQSGKYGRYYLASNGTVFRYVGPSAPGNMYPVGNLNDPGMLDTLVRAGGAAGATEQWLEPTQPQTPQGTTPSSARYTPSGGVYV